VLNFIHFYKEVHKVNDNYFLNIHNACAHVQMYAYIQMQAIIYIGIYSVPMRACKLFQICIYTYINKTTHA
jgi:hypothetical protein